MAILWRLIIIFRTIGTMAIRTIAKYSDTMAIRSSQIINEKREQQTRHAMPPTRRRHSGSVYCFAGKKYEEKEG
jgi:hypothetical protein